MLFTEVPDAHVVLCRRGVYQQTSVYRRGVRLYAKIGNGKFIGLRAHRQTTDPKIIWDYIDVGYEIERMSSAIIVQEPNEGVQAERLAKYLARKKAVA